VKSGVANRSNPDYAIPRLSLRVLSLCGRTPIFVQILSGLPLFSLPYDSTFGLRIVDAPRTASDFALDSQAEHDV